MDFAPIRKAQQEVIDRELRTAERAVTSAKQRLEDAETTLVDAEKNYAQQKVEWQTILDARTGVDQAKVLLKQANIGLATVKEKYAGWEAKKAAELLPVGLAHITDEKFVEVIAEDAMEIVRLEAQLSIVEKRIEHAMEQRQQLHQATQEIAGIANESMPRRHDRPKDLEYWVQSILLHAKQLRGEGHHVLGLYKNNYFYNRLIEALLAKSITPTNKKDRAA